MRLSLATRASLLVGTAAAVPTLFACLNHPLKPVEYDGAQELQKGIQLTVNKDVDILFVIDNSGSMGEEQANLSANFPSFIGVLEAPDVKANYRIGVTTTDNGNPYCSTGPEAGKLQMSSCLQRQGEFIFTGTPPADVTAIACTDNCDVMDMNIQGTATELDANETPRPWLENIEGKTNLPDTDGDGEPDYTTTQAFQCFGPQGIAGCGFEAHLESMYKAFLRAENADEAQYGFLRAAAILSIVIVTDEVDCSYNNDHVSIFYDPEDGGLQAFWEDPSTMTPSSALCWNAGVACTGGPGTYEECHSENYSEDGTPGANAEDAVLHPLSRYVDFVQELEDRKGEYTPDAQVLVALIAGVPIGYETGMSELVFQDATGTEQQDFGIGAGCINNATDPVATARPPVREREFAEAFEIGDERNAFSICATDFAPALGSIANAIRDQLKPACMPACVADTNPVTADILDPQCNLIQEAPKPGGGIQETSIPPCGANDAVPDGADVCFVALVDDSGATASELDDLSDECIMDGWNLEFRLVRRNGVPAPGGTSVKATCQLSTQKEIDCPDL